MSVIEKTAENVRAEVARRAMKTSDLASLWEVTPDCVLKKLKGSIRISVEELASLASRLDIPIAKLLEGIDLSPIDVN